MCDVPAFCAVYLTRRSAAPPPDAVSGRSSLDVEKGEIDDPEWRAQFNASYTHGPLEVFLQGRYIGEGAFNIEGTPEDQDVFGLDDYWGKML